MKNYFHLVTLLVFMLVGCNSSNSTKNQIDYTLNGDFLTLEFQCDSTDSLDVFGFAGPYLKNIYIHQNYGECRVTLIFNNNHIEEYNVTEKTEEKTKLYFKLDGGKTIHLDKENQVVSYFSHHNSFSRTESSASYYLLGCGDYKITSVTQKDQLSSNTAPSYNDIFNYRLNGEAKGKVKKITSNIHSRKKMFGQDSLLSPRVITREYNNAGNIISSNDETKFAFRFEYDEIGRLTKRIYRGYIVNYEGKPEDGSCKMSTKDEYQISTYDEGLIKSIDRYEFNKYSKEYELDEKIVYNGKTSIVYNSDGEERYKNKYDDKMSLIEGYVAMNDLFLGNWDVYGGEYNIGGRTELRHCRVTHNGPTTKISFTYPYSRPTTDVGTFTYDDEITYDLNCNPTKRVVRYYDSYNREFTTDTYIMLYKYDEHGNWIARHEILVSHKKGSYETYLNAEAYVEYRDIEYQEQ